jgi:hypothetical protein
MKKQLLKTIAELFIIAMQANESEDHNVYFNFSGQLNLLNLKIQDSVTEEITFSEMIFINHHPLDIYKLLIKWKKVLQAVIIPEITLKIEQP